MPDGSIDITDFSAGRSLGLQQAAPVLFLLHHHLLYRCTMLSTPVQSMNQWWRAHPKPCAVAAPACRVARPKRGGCHTRRRLLSSVSAAGLTDHASLSPSWAQCYTVTERPLPRFSFTGTALQNLIHRLTSMVLLGHSLYEVGVSLPR